MTREKRKKAIDIFDDNFTVIDTHGHYTDEEVEQARQMAIKALEQEPFNIETYCKEHFCVMVDKDVWEKAEKALKQKPTTHGYMLVCPNCGLDVHSDFESCPRCGAKMESEE